MTDKYIRFYHSREWKQARSMALARDHYLCQDCKNNGKLTPANTVHHIQHVRDCWDKRLNLDNLETICKECHNKEHKEKSALKTNKSKIQKIQDRSKSSNVVKFESNEDFY